MKWIILTYLIGNPLFYWINTDQRTAQQLFYQLSSVVVFCLGMFFNNRALKFSKLNTLISVLMLAFVFAWFRTMTGWFIALNLLLGILVYLTIIRTISKEDIYFIMKGVGYFACFCVIILLSQVIGFDFRDAKTIFGGHILAESIFFQRSAMGMFFAQVIPMLFILTPLSLFFILPVLWSESTAAFLGVSIGILFFLWFRKRILFWVFLIIFIISTITMAFIPKVRSEAFTGFKVRICIWPTVIHDIFRNPIGYGLDSFKNPPDGGWKYFRWSDNNVHIPVKLIKTGDIVKGASEGDDGFAKMAIEGKGYLSWEDHPHNEYLWIAYEIGVQAWLILGFIFYFIWQRFKLSKRDILSVASMSVLIVYAIECVLQFPFHISRVGSFLPFILGVFYIATED